MLLQLNPLCRPQPAWLEPHLQVRIGLWAELFGQKDKGRKIKSKTSVENTQRRVQKSELRLCFLGGNGKSGVDAWRVAW